MKTFFKYILLPFVLIFSSCEEVIDVNLDTDAPRLVVQAAINWEKGTTGSQQQIKLTTTTGYFDTEIPVVSGAIVMVTTDSDTFNFDEIDNTGVYECTNFVPVINQEYTLTIVNEGQTYTATETLKAVADVLNVSQNNEGGFTGTNIEIKAFYNDPENETNYYLYKYYYANDNKIEFYADTDTFFDGNSFFSISQNSEIEAGDELTITHYGISKTYYNYMNILLTISGGGGGGPFQSPPATVRGNLVNQTNKDDYALGYFSLSESSTITYIVE
jgi:hypothetical protein